MTEILERAISVGNSISQSSVNVNIGMNESTETVYNKRKSTQSRAAASPIKAGDRLNASTNNYTQNGRNVNSDSERSSRDLSEVSRTQFYELIKENRENLA